MQSKIFFNVIFTFKKPYFKDPMRFLFWTFLNILKMSIFKFFKIIFFRRTEKSENKNDLNFHSENGKEKVILECVNFNNFRK
jgi:hypothetical protein